MSKKVQLNYVRDFQLCDRDHFKILKGISILAALVSYFCIRFLGYSWLDPVWGASAAVFLFCSGYGVSESYERKGGMPHYWENKAMKVWIPSLVVMAILALIINYNPLAWIAESPVGLKGNILYLLFGAYGVFWVLFYFVESKATRCIGLFAAALLALFFVLETKLATVMLCFPTGVLFSQYGLKYKIRSLKMPGRVAVSAVCLTLAVIGWVLGIMTEIPYIEILIWSVAYLFGALFLLIGVYTAKKLPIFGIFVPFGYMSYGLYLFHSDVLSLLKGAKDWQADLIVIALLFVVAAAFSWLRDMLIILNKNARRRKTTHLKGSMW